MCIRYICRGCQTLSLLYCEAADWNEVNPECRRLSQNPQPRAQYKRCYHCKVVEGAISVLRSMVFKQPWLETEGLGGAESRPAWEFDNGFETNFDQTDLNWKDGDGATMRLQAIGLTQWHAPQDSTDDDEDTATQSEIDSDASNQTGHQGQRESDEEATFSWNSDTSETIHNDTNEHEHQHCMEESDSPVDAWMGDLNT